MQPEGCVFLNRDDEPDGRVHTHTVVKPLDPVNDVQPGLSPSVVTHLGNPLDFERLKKLSIAALSQALPFLLIDIVMAKSAAGRR
jgi:hypothetical protein